MGCGRKYSNVMSWYFEEPQLWQKRVLTILSTMWRKGGFVLKWLISLRILKVLFVESILAQGEAGPLGSQGEGGASELRRQIGHSRALYKRNNGSEISQQWLWTWCFQILLHFGTGEVQGLLSAEQMWIVPPCPLLHRSFLQRTESRRSHVSNKKHIPFLADEGTPLWGCGLRAFPNEVRLQASICWFGKW